MSSRDSLSQFQGRAGRISEGSEKRQFTFMEDLKSSFSVGCRKLSLLSTISPVCTYMLAANCAVGKLNTHLKHGAGSPGQGPVSSSV